MSDDFKTNIKSSSVWKRGFFMLLFAVFYGVAEFVLAVLAIFQFGSALFTGSANDKVARFGQTLARYIFEIVRFVTFNTEKKPFPFSDWPEAEQQGDGEAAAPDAAAPAEGPGEAVEPGPAKSAEGSDDQPPA